jgi:LysM repeat protein
LFFFLLINVIVSAITTILVLVLWDRSQQTKPIETKSSLPNLNLPTEMVVSATAQPEYPLQPYAVSEGESVSEIAQRFNISVDDLLEINGLSDPNTIGVGTTLFVPASGENEVDIPPMEGELPSSSNTGQVEIVGVFAVGDLVSERLQIRGLGEGTISLTGWRLQDEDGNVFIFPHITLFGSGAVDIYSGSGVDNVVSLHWGSNQPVWDQGETAILLNQNGTIQATYTLP